MITTRNLISLSLLIALCSITSIQANDFVSVEKIDLGSFTLDSLPNGGSPVSAGFTTEQNDLEIVGWGLSFDYGEADPTSGSWASDIQMVLTAPSGASVTVGGFSNPGEPWDFDGSGSDLPGFYSDKENFPWKDDPQSKGDWTVSFANDWDSTAATTLSMDNTSLQLYKIPEPTTFVLVVLVGLGFTALRRR